VAENGPRQRQPFTTSLPTPAQPSANSTRRTLWRCANTPPDGTCTLGCRAVPHPVQTRLCGQPRAGPFILPSPLPRAPRHCPGGGDRPTTRPMPGECGATGDPGRGQAVCTGSRMSHAAVVATAWHCALHSRRMARCGPCARRWPKRMPFTARSKPTAARPRRRPLRAQQGRNNGCQRTPNGRCRAGTIRSDQAAGSPARTQAGGPGCRA